MGAQRRAVDAQRRLLLAVGVDIAQIKAFRLGKVHLVRRQRELATDRAPNLHVNLGAIERRLIRHFHKGDVAVAHRAAHHLLGLGPQPRVVNVLLAQPRRVMRAQAHDVAIHAKERKVLLIERDHAHKLLLKLLFGAVNVRVVHLHGAHAHQPEQLAALLIAVARPILGKAHRQLAIAARLAAKELVMHGAVHRLHEIAHPVQFHGRIHGLGVVGQVAAANKEILFGEVRRAHALIACGQLRLLRQPLQLLDHDRAVGQPQRQPRPHVIVKNKDLQLAPQLAVVALLGFLQLVQVLVQLLLVAPGRAIDALEHGVRLIPAPIRARHAHQLEAVRRNLPRMFHMRPATQILKRILLIGADHHLGLDLVAILIHAAFGQPVNQFQLIGLIMEDRARLVRRHLAIGKLVPPADDLAHALLDLLQVFGREAARLAVGLLAQVKVIVKAGVNGRPDGDLGLRVQLQHRLGHHMRGAVPDAIEPFLLLLR